ncbi:O-methyltransferase [Mariniflexile ostreae]|uniref:O-methyltransferase n=1 Tax=Mariniflexile ostreae TaxID=1520892 RepID=A0ABV5FEY0_9FLAO
MLFQVSQYIRFLLKSTNHHGVHSPFVFNLVTKCFYDKKHYESYKNILDYKNALLKNNTNIRVTDLGAGSQQMKDETRSISNMAKHAGTSLKRAKLLYRLAVYFKPKTILELGTSLGIATHALSLGNPESQISTIEGCPQISNFSKKHFEKHQIKNAAIINGDFNDEIQALTANSYDFIFFDGNHAKEATLFYFETLLKTAHNDSVFIFDDIHWSKNMTKAWNTIKKHPDVSVTIDTFYWGIVFFRKEQRKEDFVIRV